MYSQNWKNYPIARSGNDNDIIDAAKARAKFWNYNDNSSWEVIVIVGKREVRVAKSADGNFSIKR